MSQTEHSTRPHLNAAIERLRLLVQPEAESHVAVLAPTNVQPVTLERDDDEEDNGLKNIHWAPELVDGRLQQLTNGRWLRQWRRAGELEWRPPLIDEVDRSGWAGPKSWTVSSRDLAQVKGTTSAFSSCPGDGLTATFAVGFPQRGSAGRPLACSANSSGVR